MGSGCNFKSQSQLWCSGPGSSGSHLASGSFHRNYANPLWYRWMGLCSGLMAEVVRFSELVSFGGKKKRRKEKKMGPFLTHHKGNAQECSQCWPEVMGSYFPISKPCETIRDCPSLRSRGCWQWSPSGRAGVVEKRYWQALPCTHVQRLGVYLNAAAAAPRSWSCLCLAIRILGFFFLIP